MIRRALRESAFFVFAVIVSVASATAGDTETVRVLRALDGDSLRLVDGRDVRLIGINTPEFGHDGTPDQPLAAAAHRRTDELVRGRAIRLEFDRERYDRHGRTLAYAFLPEGDDLQEILLREGLAWYVAVAPNVANRERYRSAEVAARAARLGVWSIAQYEPVAAERLTRRDTGFRRVVGVVSQATQSHGWVILRLAPNVELRLSYDSATSLPAPLLGKRVVARGWLTAYKKSIRMRITDPTMLEVLP